MGKEGRHLVAVPDVQGFLQMRALDHHHALGQARFGF